MSPQNFLNELKDRYEKISNDEIAGQQKAYLRNQFAFYGIKSAPMQEVMRQMMKEYGCFSGENLIEFVHLCNGEDYRELHRAPIQMTAKVIKKQSPEFINTLEFMVTANSWWDTVDAIAKYIGIHLQHHPHLMIPITKKWNRGENMWLQRISIIFQLFYRNQTNTDLLFEYILEHQFSREFFIQKASGWALRQHSKIEPDLIRKFIEEHELSNLTKREGLRLMEKFKKSN